MTSNHIKGNWFVSVFKMRREQEQCQHEFDIDSIKNSNFEPLPKPDRSDYFGWKDYYRRIYQHDSVAKRVNSQCIKCGEVIYADCGLNLKGRLVRHSITKKEI